ncbi:MAG TPA: MATE family efflux transporter [Phycisphaerales bacterium]|nr:MATE family efflux transporter [Phycisphaerales bacterium]HCD32125.1 MATE family efflux transporter [Phycisphaerales bacterium]|tara:strand:- start:62 stop:1489 length:1428 start_codon:yes stop_codon:yes gene_type:complete
MSTLAANKLSVTQGPIGRTLIKMLLGMLVGHVAMTVFNLTDTYFVAQLGTEPLAAMSFTFPIIFTIMSVIFGLGIGTSSVISQAIGKGDFHQAQRLTTHALYLAVLVSIVLSALGLIFTEDIFYAMGARDEVLRLTKLYMHIWFWGMPLVTIPMMGNNALRATGDTGTAGMIMGGGAMVNLILDPIMIFGLLGFPKWGIAGAAIATLFGRGFALVSSLWVLYYKKKLICFEMPGLTAMLNSWRQLVYIGIPAALTGALGPLTAAVITWLVSDYGTEAVAAAGAGVKIDSITIMVLASLGSVLMPFVGQNWGAGRMDRVREAHRWVYKFSLLWGGFMYGVVILFSGPIARAFSDDPVVIDLIVMYLYITPVCLGMAGLWRIVSGAMNGLHQPMHSAALNLVALLVLGLPSVVIGSSVFGLKGLFAGMAVGNILAGIAAIVWAGIVHRKVEAKKVSSETNVMDLDDVADGMMPAVES